MGANQSNLGANGTGPNDSDMALSAKLASRHGFQILRVHPNSPVSEAHLQAYFDFIISINGVDVVGKVKSYCDSDSLSIESIFFL